MRLRNLVYRLYTRRLEAALTGMPVPRHVGVILDGNRRWARAAGMPDFSGGYRKGGDRVFELLQWCDEAGVEVVTLWLLSTDNLARATEQLRPLLRVIEETVQGLVAQRWHVNPMGALDLLPDETARVLKDAAEATAGYGGLVVNVAVGYGGRREIADAVRSLLQDHANKGTSIEELAEVSGRARILSSISATRSGRTSAKLIFFARCATTPPAGAVTAHRFRLPTPRGSAGGHSQAIATPQPGHGR